MTRSGSLTLSPTPGGQFYRRNGPYYNVLFEDGSEAGDYFKPGDDFFLCFPNGKFIHLKLIIDIIN